MIVGARAAEDSDRYKSEMKVEGVKRARETAAKVERRASRSTQKMRELLPVLPGLLGQAASKKTSHAQKAARLKAPA